MTLTIKYLFTDEPLWKLALRGFKYYCICYLLILVPYTAIRFSHYYAGKINGSQMWNLAVSMWCISCGIVWFCIKNKQNMSKNINKEKRSKEFFYKTGIYGVLFILSCVALLFISYLLYGFSVFPGSILYDISWNSYQGNFPSELLRDTLSLFFGSINFVDTFKMWNFALIFTSYNTMKYLFDKSILA